MRGHKWVLMIVRLKLWRTQYGTTSDNAGKRNVVKKGDSKLIGSGVSLLRRRHGF